MFGCCKIGCFLWVSFFWLLNSGLFVVGFSRIGCVLLVGSVLFDSEKQACFVLASLKWLVSGWFLKHGWSFLRKMCLWGFLKISRFILASLYTIQHSFFPRKVRPTDPDSRYGTFLSRLHFTMRSDCRNTVDGDAKSRNSTTELRNPGF